MLIIVSVIVLIIFTYPENNKMIIKNIKKLSTTTKFIHRKVVDWECKNPITDKI